MPSNLTLDTATLASLTIYADAIVFPAWNLQAARLWGRSSIGDIEKVKPQPDLAADVKQMLVLKPLVDAGVAKLARPGPPDWETQHNTKYLPLATELHKNLAAKTIVQTRNNGLVFNIAGFSLQGFLPGPVSDKELEESSADAQSNIHKSNTRWGKAFREMLAHALFDAMAHAELAAAVRGHPVWSDVSTWQFVQTCLGIPAGKRLLGEPTLTDPGIMLLEKLPHLNQIELTKLVELREEYRPHLDRFRGAISQMSASIGEIAAPDARNEEAVRIIREEINPAIAEIDLEFKAAVRKKSRYASAVLGTTTVSLMAAFFTGQPLLAGISALTIPYLSELLKDATGQDQLEQNPLFFLWQAARARRR